MEQAAIFRKKNERIVNVCGESREHAVRSDPCMTLWDIYGGKILKYSGIGGQAVLEGIMMKNKDNYATAVRKPDGEIVVKKDTSVSMTEKVKFFSLPCERNL